MAKGNNEKGKGSGSQSGNSGSNKSGGKATSTSRETFTRKGTTSDARPVKPPKKNK